ncbi:type II toxin-antitoxin system death-on-curing family toxin [Sphingobium algorifonticola]|uniref:Type II toxin-antitoxin system death-on-curing family toxin n=1 Tax=Sphingobium algorifonticola TaxID=2008318 RepID=A0A437J7I5_9SPHN|nr:type II toxin-antitoxin system death-on-curing family toxin [Sphingobium algorifonticola]RVT41130.1 type II toxin-antitoxin system death-on-curing family toxin [Sphingobium algorifonticola]
MTNALGSEPKWVTQDVILAVHDRQLTEHGGGAGVRDIGLLESALARPLNRWSYGDDDMANLAAAYAFGIARNHPFVDGNKRTAWIAARLFIALNGGTLVFDKIDAINTVLALAAGDLPEDALAAWLRERLKAA